MVIENLDQAREANLPDKAAIIESHLPAFMHSFDELEVLVYPESNEDEAGFSIAIVAALGDDKRLGRAFVTEEDDLFGDPVVMRSVLRSISVNFATFFVGLTEEY